MTPAPEDLADAMRKQSAWCERLGSPFYAALFLRIADDVEASGVCWSLLAARMTELQRMNLPLRFAAAVHRLVLEGKLPDLAPHFPGNPDSTWPVLLDALKEHDDLIRARIPQSLQTSEVKRCCALLPGFLEVARRTGLRLRLLEIGSSSGLSLRWDHYRYEANGEAWGPANSPLVFRGMFADGPLQLDVDARVAERRGCDLNPIDPVSEDGRLTLQSFLWPDQRDRLERMEKAIEVARRVPAVVDRADAVEWLEAQLAQPRPGLATVVFHSVVVMYLGPEARGRMQEILGRAGARATAEAPLAWLSMEPGDGEANVHLTVWPGGERRAIARAGFHGGQVVVLKSAP